MESAPAARSATGGTKRARDEPYLIQPGSGMVPLTSSPFYIGRGEHCHLRLTGVRISRTHAHISMAGDTWHVEDVSSNGVWVGSHRIASRTSFPLTDQCELSIGSPDEGGVTLTFRRPGEEAAAAADEEPLEGRSDGAGRCDAGGVDVGGPSDLGVPMREGGHELPSSPSADEGSSDESAEDAVMRGWLLQSQHDIDEADAEVDEAEAEKYGEVKAGIGEALAASSSSSAAVASAAVRDALSQVCADLNPTERRAVEAATTRALSLILEDGGHGHADPQLRAGRTPLEVFTNRGGGALAAKEAGGDDNHGEEAAGSDCPAGGAARGLRQSHLVRGGTVQPGSGGAPPGFAPRPREAKAAASKSVQWLEGLYGGKTAARFGAPPFSVLDARKGYWKERRHYWEHTYHIHSERGRQDNLIGYKGLGGDEARGTSVFCPVLTELVYRWFCPAGGSVLDPFAGGSVRGCVAARTGLRYTGVDLAKAQVEENRRQAKKIGAIAEAASAKWVPPSWVCADSRRLHDLPAVGHAYDFVFSCPPYYDLERYSEDPDDLSLAASYSDFLEGYRQIIAAALHRLAADRFCCFVVGEIRDADGFCRNFVSDTISAVQDAGARLYNHATMLLPLNTLPIRASKTFNATSKLGNCHQHVLVFYKGRHPNKNAKSLGLHNKERCLEWN